MTRRRFAVAALAAALLATSSWTTRPVAFQTQGNALEPLVYTIRFPQPVSRTFTVDVVVPTERRESVDLMMAIWSPGFYGLQNYADRVSSVHRDRAGRRRARGDEADAQPLDGEDRRPALLHHHLTRRGAARQQSVERRDRDVGRDHRTGDLHHARRKRASSSRGPARAAGRLEGIDDVARRVERRQAESLRRARLRHPGGFADSRRRRICRSRRSRSAASSTTGRISARPSGTARRPRPR